MSRLLRAALMALFLAAAGHAQSPDGHPQPVVFALEPALGIPGCRPVAGTVFRVGVTMIDCRGDLSSSFQVTVAYTQPGQSLPRCSPQEKP